MESNTKELTNNQNQEDIIKAEEIGSKNNDAELLRERFNRLNISTETLTLSEGASIYSFKGDPQDRKFDTFARLFTNNKKGEEDKCIAICFHEEGLIITSNRKRTEYAEKYMEKLQKFANERSHDNCKELLEIAIKQTSIRKPWRKRVKDKLGAIIPVNKPKTFRKLVKEYQNSDKIINLNDLQEAAQITFNKVKELNENSRTKKRANQKWSHLIQWHDTGEIIEAIMNNDEEIISVISQKLIPIEFESEKQNNLHAEMKIIDKLHGERDSRYLGISKLPCPSCQAVISILNSEGYSWKTYADESHGNPYDGWVTPKIMEGREEEIDSWKKANKSKQTKKQTTSEIPADRDKLMDIVQLLNNLQMQENLQEQSSTQAQIEQPTK